MVFLPAQHWEMNRVKSTCTRSGLFVCVNETVELPGVLGESRTSLRQDLEGVRGQGKWCDLSHLCRWFAEQWQERGGRMNVGTAHSEVNPNTRVMNSRGIWLSYVLAIGLLHVVLLSIPFVSVPVVWTLTNLIHNMVRPVCRPPSRAGCSGGTEGWREPPGVGKKSG